MALERAKIERPSKSVMTVGLRGMGKTVLLDRIREDASANGTYALPVEAPENRPLASMHVRRTRTEALYLPAGVSLEAGFQSCEPLPASAARLHTQNKSQPERGQ